MIPYHGTPITPDHVASSVLAGAHGFVSFARPDQLGIVVDVCQSFAIDNGAFAAWKAGSPVTDWSAYYTWAEDCMRLPHCDFAVIPDVIGGTDTQNDALAEGWPLPRWFGAPVWHLDASLDRLRRLIAAGWPRICLGSAGEYSRVGDAAWWNRIWDAMSVICDEHGRPRVRLHGLRMLNPAVYSRLPFSSCDSTNVGRNVNIDSRWKGTYSPPTKTSRAHVLRARAEAFVSPPTWNRGDDPCLS